MKKLIIVLLLFASVSYGADKKISDLTAASAIGGGSLFEISYKSGASYYSRKMTWAQFMTFMGDSLEKITSIDSLRIKNIFRLNNSDGSVGLELRPGGISKNNTSIGTNALRSTTATYSTALGVEAAYTAGASEYVTALGFQSLYANITGQKIVAVGANALRTNTANYNTALGYAAGYTNSTHPGLTAIGFRSGYTSNADYNTFIGYDCGYYNTNGQKKVNIGAYAAYNDTANYGTVIGCYAGYTNTAGIGLTLVGFRAGYGNTTADYTTAYGYEAAYSITNGTSNQAIGKSALYTLTTGDYNNANGYEALYTNNGNYNTADGYHSAYANNGSYNTSNGAESFYYNSTGDSCTMGGFRTGYFNFNGTGNTGYGHKCLVSNAVGDYNTAFGDEALFGSHTYGDTVYYNTIIGCRAGFNFYNDANANTYLGYKTGYTNLTGANGVFLGAYAGEYETASNKLFIDNQTRTTEAIARHQSLVYGLFAAVDSSQFVSVNADLQSLTYNHGRDAGSNDTYVISLNNAPKQYVMGMMVVFYANTLNTGACTLNVNGLGAKPLKMLHDQDPPDSYIEAGSYVMAVYDGTNFQIMQPDANP